MVKGMYSRMIKNFQLYGGYQYLQYIDALLMKPEFLLMENMMSHIM